MSSREPEQDLVSLFSVGTVLLRRARLIILLGLAGGILGLVLGLTAPKRFTSSASFVPQSSEGPASGLSALAGQFGVRVPGIGGGGSWTPALYVELLTSRTILEALALDTVTVVEEDNRRAAVVDLLNVEPGPVALRAVRGATALRDIVRVREDKQLNLVRLSVSTKWPSVSYAMVQRLLDRVNTFNIEKRRSSAAAERRFIEAQVDQAEVALRRAEDRLELFDRSNRAITGAPQLVIERDRLQREVTHQQQIYTALLQSLDDARIRELRDLDAITMIEQPVVSPLRDARGTARVAVLGGIAGGLLGVVIALALANVASARRGKAPEAAEFYAALAGMWPSWLRRRSSRA